MPSLCARDLMNTEVVKVPPETPVLALARLFTDRGVSAIAVTDAAGSLLGIVTASDLIRRLADEDEQPAGWLARLLDSPVARAERYARSHGVKAGEMMTTPVITVGPAESAAHIAHLMEEHNIRRVLVVEGEQVVGLVSRPDLVCALIPREQAPEGERSDEQIHRALTEEMRRQPWAQTVFAAAHVQNGVVEFHGFSPSATISRALCVLAENVPGVRGVVDHTRHRMVRDPS